MRRISKEELESRLNLYIDKDIKNIITNNDVINGVNSTKYNFPINKPQIYQPSRRRSPSTNFA